MPCRDDYNDDSRISHTELNRLGSVEAAFCGIVSVLEQTDALEKVLKQVDWAEAGVTKKQFRTLWAEHKAKDEARREREAAERARLQKIEQAKAKLSGEERKLLGIK